MRLVINGLFGERPNTGTDQYVINLAKELARSSQHDIILLRPNWRGRARRKEEVDTSSESRQLKTVGVPVPLGGNLGKLWFEQISVPSAARRLEADLLHVPYLGSPLLSPCPVVVTIHDLIMKILPEYKGSLGVRSYTRLVCQSAKRADMVIVDSECTRRDVARLLGIAGTKIRVVYLGCDGRYWRKLDDSVLSAVREKYGLSKKFVLYIGGLDSRKNVDRLIEAFGMIRGDWELAVAGQPHSENTAIYPVLDEAMRRSGAANRIKLLGFVPESDKPALYMAASLFVYPSLYEGFGLPPLEAMACGTPIVCSNSSSLPEVVGTGGVLVDPYNCAGMAQSMQEVLDNEQAARELRRLAKEQARRFSWQRTAAETLSIYDEVLNAARC